MYSDAHGFRHLRPPLTDADFGPLPPNASRVQVFDPLTGDEYRRLGAFLAANPEIWLRINSHSEITDLEFLKYFPALLKLSLELYGLQNIDGFRHLRSDLAELSWGECRSKRFSLSALTRFQALKRLGLDGHKKDVAALGRMTSLQALTLSSIRVPDLRVLEPLQSLETLSFWLGGATDLAPLSALKSIRELLFIRVLGLSDLAVLGQMFGLERLIIEDQPQVRALPDMSKLIRLCWVQLQNLKGLTDFAPLAAAPALEEVRMFSMGHTGPAALMPFLRHPALRRGIFLFGSDAKNAEAARMFAHLDPSDP
jgi:hypothetical protein